MVSDKNALKHGIRRAAARYMMRSVYTSLRLWRIIGSITGAARKSVAQAVVLLFKRKQTCAMHGVREHARDAIRVKSKMGRAAGGLAIRRATKYLTIWRIECNHWVNGRRAMRYALISALSKSLILSMNRWHWYQRIRTKMLNISSQLLFQKLLRSVGKWRVGKDVLIREGIMGRKGLLRWVKTTCTTTFTHWYGVMLWTVASIAKVSMAQRKTALKMQSVFMYDWVVFAREERPKKRATRRAIARMVKRQLCTSFQNWREVT